MLFNTAKRWYKVTAVFLLLSVWLSISLIGPPTAGPTAGLGLVVEKNRTIKTILLWNAPQRPEVLIFGTGHDTFVQHGCPVSDCELVNSRFQYPDRPVSSYDAIVFNINDQFGLGRRPRGSERRAGQRYVFLTQEPPPALKDQNLEGYRNYFNWTMTYRMDSDIRLLYGRIRPADRASAPGTQKTDLDLSSLDGESRWIQLKSRNVARKKKMKAIKVKNGEKRKKLVAAMISHCHTDSRREDYIKELKKYVQVDVYGWCDQDGLGSGLRCDTDELLTSSPECYDMLEANYMFYLSFENAICRDYVTEKFFHIMSRRRIVAVVYGGADYAELAPTHSYIDALHMEPKRLARYLQRLAANQTLYDQYFWWKDRYTVEAGLQQMVRHAFCDLCQKLHQDRGQIKIYQSLIPKWHPGRCYRPNYPSFNRFNRPKRIDSN